MKMRTFFMASIVSAMVVALAVTAVAVALILENRNLQSNLQDVRAELDHALLEKRDTAAEKQAARAEMAEQTARLDELSAQIELLKASPPEAKREPLVVRPPIQGQRVRAFLGNEQVGMGWLVPSQIRTNAADGQVSYEPVIVLDETVRKRVEIIQTNVVEREVSPQSTSVVYNVPHAYATYSSGWPIYRVRPGRPSVRPQDPTTQPQQPPQVPSPFLSTRTWHPQSGWTQSAPGRPGGQWISSGTGAGTRVLPPGNPTGSSPFPARY